jgi:hypothetical protein
MSGTYAPRVPLETIASMLPSDDRDAAIASACALRTDDADAAELRPSGVELFEEADDDGAPIMGDKPLQA